jgi:hypothetical protein
MLEHLEHSSSSSVCVCVCVCIYIYILAQNYFAETHTSEIKYVDVHEVCDHVVMCILGYGNYISRQGNYGDHISRLSLTLILQE